MNYPPLRGVLGDVIFMDHDFPESNLEGSTTKENDKEAQLVANMLVYLL